jgi:hypothetical protein
MCDEKYLFLGFLYKKNQPLWEKLLKVRWHLFCQRQDTKKRTLEIQVTLFLQNIQKMY